MSFLQPGKRCRTGGSRRFFRYFLPPLLTLSVTLFNVWLLLVLVNVKSESGTHTAVLFLAKQKLWHLLLGTMAFFLLVHRHWQFSVCLFENVRIGSARQLVYPQKAHPPQSPSLSWHITATSSIVVYYVHRKRRTKWETRFCMTSIQREYLQKRYPFSSSTA